jgi:hypothetical protein
MVHELVFTRIYKVIQVSGVIEMVKRVTVLKTHYGATLKYLIG